MSKHASTETLARIARRLPAIYARYKRQCEAKKPDVVDKLAAKLGIYPSTLLRMFKRHGFPTLNIKPKWPAPKKREIRKWHKEYLVGKSLKALGKKYHHTAAFFSDHFRALGLKVFTVAEVGYQPFPRKTPEEIEALIQQAKCVCVPKELTHEWRSWKMDRRMDFIARIRKKLNSPRDQPTTPFSSNLEPFQYGSPNVCAIVKRMNAGRNSRNKVIALKPSSQGVLWRGRVFFWVSNLPESSGGTYQLGGDGPYVRGVGRLLLHHLIWEDHAGQKVPAGHVVRLKDNNPNNLDPLNMYLHTKADVAAANSSTRYKNKSRKLTALLVQRFEGKENNANHELVERLGATRRPRRCLRTATTKTAITDARA